MPEFRKHIDLPAARLSRSDVENLGRLITDGLPVNPKALDFSLSKGDATYRAYSLKELLSNDLPSSIDDLSFRVHGWTDDNIIDRSIFIDLHRTIASCRIYSLDEVWLKGKIQQITEFFRERRPWYGEIRKSLPGLFGAMQAIFFIALFFFFWKHQFFFLVVAGLTLAALSKGFGAFLKGKLFPLIDIQLVDKPRRLDRETWMLIFTAIGTLATVAGVIIQTMQKGTP